MSLVAGHYSHHLEEIKAHGGVTSDANAFPISSSSTMSLDSTDALELNSSAGAISLGNDAVAQAVNIATGAAARVITVGNAASASMALDAGVGAFSVLADTTMDLDSGDILSLNSSGGAINVGDNAVAQPVNIATGVAARVVSIGSTSGGVMSIVNGGSALSINSDLSVNIGTNASGGVAVNLATVGAKVVSVGSGSATSLTLASGGVCDVDSAAALSLNSSAGVINIGNDVVAQVVNIATGGARAVVIGNPSSASLSLEGGVGATTMQTDTTMDLDAGTGLSINCSSGPINIGNDAVVQAINIGNGAIASLSLEGGVGATTMQTDTTMDLDAGTGLSINCSSGAINVGNDAVAQSLNLGTAGARGILIGSAAASSMALDAGVGMFSVLADTTMDLDSGTTLSLNSSGGVINIGNDAVAQNILIGTAGARAILVGAAATTSMGINAGTGNLNLTSAGNQFCRHVFCLNTQNTPTDFGAMGGNVTPTAAQVFVSMHGDPNGAARTVQLPSAADLVAGMSGVAVDDSIDIFLINESTTGTQLLTVLLGADTTNVGSLIVYPLVAAQFNSASGYFRIRFTNVTGASEAVVVYRI